MTLQLSRTVGFLDLSPTTAPKHQRSIGRAREAVEGLVRDLASFADDVRRDHDLTENGQRTRLLRGLGEAAKAVRGAMAGARADVDADRSKAAGTLHGRLWAGLDNPARLAPVQQSLLALLGRDPVPSKYPTDGQGHALLLAGGKTLGILSEVIRGSALDDARVTTLAALRADPLLKHLLGGPPVLDALTHAITERVVGEDPEAASLHAQVEAAEALLSQINTDEQRSIEAAAHALGLPKETAHAIGRADPVRAAATAK